MKDSEKRYIPSADEIQKTLDTLAKAWPVLAEHASHMDGSFNLAHSKAKRMFEALSAALVEREQDRAVLLSHLEDMWRKAYRLGKQHGEEQANHANTDSQLAGFSCRDMVKRVADEVGGADA